MFPSFALFRSFAFEVRRISGGIRRITLPLDTLTDRERQIVLHASLGLTNKQIAYTLGISDATVRVLMARAARRMGVRTRRELLAHSALRAMRPAE